MEALTPHDIHRMIDSLSAPALAELHRRDFLLTWDKSREGLEAVLQCALILKALRVSNISPRIYDSGIAVSQFRDNSTRTRFSFASACNLLGLTVADLDEGKSQVAHGETVRETANMISFMAEVIGIRDDMYIGKGHAYMLRSRRPWTRASVTACWSSGPRWSTSSATSTIPRSPWRTSSTSWTRWAAWRSSRGRRWR